MLEALHHLKNRQDAEEQRIARSVRIGAGWLLPHKTYIMLRFSHISEQGGGKWG